MDYELLEQNNSGADEKDAVTAKHPWQANVDAAVDEAWQIPPFCKYPVARLWCLMGPEASKTKRSTINETK